MRPLAALLVPLLALPTGLAACAGAREAPSVPPVAAPRRRTGGPRAIPFAGGDPASKGWVQVDGLLWVEAADVEAFQAGRLRSGDRYVPFDEADAVPKDPENGYVLRTDHLVLRTNVSFGRARELARIAETHIGRVLDVFGAPLDLRLPADPLPIVVAARREEFQRLLARCVDTPVEWGAFYLAQDGTVYASDERRPQGGLSVVADLRHEMTHAILDLGRSDAGRARMFHRPHFWLWEATAMWTEGLGDPAGAREGSERFARFARRLAWGDVVPLCELFDLGQDEFLGRHYDEAASFMSWLMDADGGAHRPGVLALLVRVMDGVAECEDFRRLVGLTPEEADRRWRASLGG